MPCPALFCLLLFPSCSDTLLTHTQTFALVHTCTEINAEASHLRAAHRWRTHGILSKWQLKKAIINFSDRVWQSHGSPFDTLHWVPSQFSILCQSAQHSSVIAAKAAKSWLSAGMLNRHVKRLQHQQDLPEDNDRNTIFTKANVTITHLRLFVEHFVRLTMEPLW